MAKEITYEETKEEKNLGGRPLKYTSNEELQNAIDRYFVECDNEKRPYTISGLAYALDINRERLLQYQKLERFHDTVTRAKEKVIRYAEETLWNAKNPSGVIFSMKNNFPLAFRDKVETEQSGEITIKWAD